MTLQAELDAFRAGWEVRVGEEMARIISGDIDDLRHSGILDRVPKAGDRLPAAPGLLDVHKRPFDLGGLLARQPTIVTFYRGGWCPYCNLELRAYQAQIDEIRALGAELVAISPELPDHTMTTAEKNDLSFTVLSDVGSAFSIALGLRFLISDAARVRYEAAGSNLPERNGDGAWAVPVPATFIVEKGGRIAKAFVEPDYRLRLDPEEAVAALRGMVQSSAA